MENEIVMRMIIAVIILFILLVPAARLLGEDRLAETTKKNVTPETTIALTDENVEVEVRPLEDGYLYEITSSPGLNIDTDSAPEAFVVMSFKNQHIKANVVGAEGDEDTTFIAKYGAQRHTFKGQITSFIPPLAEWNARPLEQEIPVIVKSIDTQAPVIVRARTKEVIDLDSGLDLSPYQTCKADVEVSCPGDLKFTRYLQLCKSDGPQDVCEQTLEVCGGTMEITVVQKPDCSKREVEVNMFYRGGKTWQPGELVGISFWNKKCEERTESADYNQLLVLCAEYRLGGVKFMNAGIITT